MIYYLAEWLRNYWIHPDLVYFSILLSVLLQRQLQH